MLGRLSLLWYCLVFSVGRLAADDAKAQAAPDFSKGMLCGKVLDAASGKPLADATVALQDKDGKVVGWAKTDAEGQYAIATDSLKALNLQPSRRRGLLDEISRGVGQVVTAPIKVAGGVIETVKKTSPAETVKNAALSTATGNPLPLTAQIAAQAAPVQQARSAPADAATQTKEAAVRTVFGERLNGKETRKVALAPGEVFIAVSRADYKEARGKAGAFWLDPAIPPAKEKRDDRGTGVRAWMETVRLAPASAADKKSEIASEAVLLSDARAEPTLAPAGSVCKVSVRLATPGIPPEKARVFAREAKKGTIIELVPKEKGVYAGELPIDRACPPGDTKVSVAALRVDPIEVRLPKAKEDPLLLFARRLDDLEPSKPYEYDPRIMASENRLDLTLTILDPKQATPPSGAPKPGDKK